MDSKILPFFRAFNAHQPAGDRLDRSRCVFIAYGHGGIILVGDVAGRYVVVCVCPLLRHGIDRYGTAPHRLGLANRVGSAPVIGRRYAGQGNGMTFLRSALRAFRGDGRIVAVSIFASFQFHIR